MFPPSVLDLFTSCVLTYELQYYTSFIVDKPTCSVKSCTNTTTRRAKNSFSQVLWSHGNC